MVEISYNKIQIAIEQLEVSLRLFLSGDSHVSALTLAGAAEEILGMALKHNGIKNSLEKLHDSYRLEGLEWINPPMPWHNFTRQVKNKIWNEVKHFATPDDLKFDADMEEEATWMIVRAMENYRGLGFSPTAKMHEFDEWFYTHIVGN